MKTQKRKRNKIIILENEAGELCSKKNEVEDMWMQYIEKLYGDANRKTRLGNLACHGRKPASKITIEKLEQAIQIAKTRKVIGADGISIKILKCASRKSKEKLLILINNIYIE